LRKFLGKVAGAIINRQDRHSVFIVLDETTFVLFIIYCSIGSMNALIFLNCPFVFHRILSKNFAADLLQFLS